MTTSSTRRAPVAAAAAALVLAVLLVASSVPLPLLAQPGGTPEPTQPTAPAGPTGRLAGPTRIDTAVAISERAFPDGAEVAYLARADDPADAVAGGALTDGPVLLVPSCGEVPDVVAAELRRLAATQVLALGGDAAICEDLLAAAGAVVSEEGSGGEPGEPTEPGAPAPAAVVVTAEAAIVESTSEPPFSVEAQDPGIVREGERAHHDIRFLGSAGTVVLADPRFSDVLANTDGEGQLVLVGPGCGPARGAEGTGIACTEEFRFVEVREGERTAIPVTIHTADPEVGPEPLVPGTYVLEQLVRWEDDTAAGDPTGAEFDDGEAVVRVTYTVQEQPTEGPEARVVTWETPEGTFRTNGHSAEDLVRIQDGVERNEHIGIPVGSMARGDGGVNTGHDWHLVGVELADVTIELCDATVAYVDANLEDWMAQVGSYCPWGAIPIAIE